MKEDNQTLILDFVLAGISNIASIQKPLFAVFLLIYLITILSNSMIILVTSLDSRLYKPMYFFLKHLSFLDVCCTSVTFPKLLDIISGHHHISFMGCISQIYFFLALTSAEFLLLTAMAYDRYVAICNPLRYSALMNPRACHFLAAGSWALGFLDTMPPAILSSQLSFCSSNYINHFFCDLVALMKNACGGTQRLEILIFAEGLFSGLMPFVLTITSYVHIISTIMKISSASGRSKAFSTCTSHLTVVIIFYGTVLCMYMRPTSVYELNQDKLYSVLYIALIPVLNPMIYTLRNKDVKGAIRKMIVRQECGEHI
ncbi:olfactory receptor 5V1-like [Pleurodeles waltl]|uniref:olfactory receptor 5V1-like n=1 Tax=Pleurodeles waltl TaxID=8319 RepID=UPI0037094C9C